MLRHEQQTVAPTVPQLLVSVRNLREARAAAEGGAQLLDVKEPTQGSLGAASENVWHEVATSFGSQIPLSVALGEFSSLSPIPQLPSEVTAVKLGLSGWMATPGARESFGRYLRNLPSSIQRVAVYYADHAQAGSPGFEELLSVAAENNAGTILIDTFHKHLGNVLSHLPLRRLSAMGQAIRQRGFRFVLAGSISLEDLDTAVAVEPDIVAVRGAACVGDRTGTVSAALVNKLRHKLFELSTA